MSKEEQAQSTPQPEVEAPPPVYPAMPQSSPYPQANTPGGEYPMQQVHTPSGYPMPQQTGGLPVAGSTPAPVDPAMAAAIAGQQYRDQRNYSLFEYRNTIDIKTLRIQFSPNALPESMNV